MTRLGTCARCGAEAVPVHEHHRKLRSRGGDDSPANLVDVCVDCHNWIHANPAEATAEGWMVASWDDPAEVQLTVDGHEVPHDQVVGEKHEHDGVQPGEKCPTCKRRVNKPRTAKSPTSKVVSMRMPNDDAETYEELLEACAEHVGVKTSESYWKHKVTTVALARLLQTDATALRRELQGRGG